MLRPQLELIRRIQHIRVQNYIENIVNNYNERDFIMHFRLSRAITYDLINRFGASNIFTSIQSKYVFI